MRIRFVPTPTLVDARRGESLLDLAVRAGLPLGRACGGEGVCRSCVVDVMQGARQLAARSDAELRWRLPAGRRLACQARISADAAAPALPSDEGDDDAEIVIWCPSWGVRPLAPPR